MFIGNIKWKVLADEAGGAHTESLPRIEKPVCLLVRSLGPRVSTDVSEQVKEGDCKKTFIKALVLVYQEIK